MKIFPPPKPPSKADRINMNGRRMGMVTRRGPGTKRSENTIPEQNGPVVKYPARPSIETIPSPSFTVVITNFQRPSLVFKAFQSCLKAGITRIVVSASGADVDLLAVHANMREMLPEVVIDAIPDDRGCNEMWLRGVRLAQTPYVHLLHDDDLVLQNFGKMVADALRGNPNFLHMAGQKHDAGDHPITGTHKPLGGNSTGKKSTGILNSLLLRAGGLSISPVSGVFRREDLLSVLEECERIRSPRFELHPNMMVGNDLLIWLRCMEKYDEFYYISEPLISYGHHAGSATCDDIFGGHNQLAPLYDAMREYWRITPTPSPLPGLGLVPVFPLEGMNTEQAPKVIHCVELHEDKDPGAIRRKNTAKQSWQNLYVRGAMAPAHYGPSYHRDSTLIHDPRGLPFIKDVLAWGIQFANWQDIILFSNDDSILHPGLPDVLLSTLLPADLNHGALSSHRCEYRNPPNLDGSFFKQEIISHPGRDIFAFTIPWLREHWGRIPDYLLGAPCFDIALAMMIRTTQGVTTINPTTNQQCWEKELPLGYVAHIMHAANWHVKYRTYPANGWNNQLAKEQTTRLYPGKTWDEMQRL